jgi:hypothetical protein
MTQSNSRASLMDSIAKAFMTIAAEVTCSPEISSLKAYCYTRSELCSTWPAAKGGLRQARDLPESARQIHGAASAFASKC